MPWLLSSLGVRGSLCDESATRCHQGHPRPADTRAMDRRVLICAICFWLLAAGCAASDQGNPAGDTAALGTTCVQANADRLPYSFCVPDTWRVGDVVHMDGSLDIVMIGGTGEVLGFAKASGPVDPGGRVNRFVPFPESVIGAAARKRLLIRIGFEPNAVRDLSIESLRVDGQTGALLTLTIDIGEPDAVSRFFALRVPVGGVAGIELTFVFGASDTSEDVVREVMSTVRIDSTLVEEAIQGKSSADPSPT